MAFKARLDFVNKEYDVLHRFYSLNPDVNAISMTGLRLKLKNIAIQRAALIPVIFLTSFNTF